MTNDERKKIKEGFASTFPKLAEMLMEQNVNDAWQEHLRSGAYQKGEFDRKASMTNFASPDRAVLATVLGLCAVLLEEHEELQAEVRRSQSDLEDMQTDMRRLQGKLADGGDHS